MLSGQVRSCPHPNQDCQQPVNPFLSFSKAEQIEDVSKTHEFDSVICHSNLPAKVGANGSWPQSHHGATENHPLHSSGGMTTMILLCPAKFSWRNVSAKALHFAWPQWPKRNTLRKQHKILRSNHDQPANKRDVLMHEGGHFPQFFWPPMWIGPQAQD